MTPENLMRQDVGNIEQASVRASRPKGFKPKLATASVAVVSAATLAVVGLVPATANNPIILPDASDIISYACTDYVHILAPRVFDPVNGLSEYDPIQPGRLAYSLKNRTNNTQLSTGSGDLISYSANATPGTTLQLKIDALMFDPNNDAPLYSPSSLEFDIVVPESSFSQGNGSQENPFIINSEADLNKVRCYQDAYFALGQNITLQSDWLPIRFRDSIWRGSLDGRGYSISGLRAIHPTLSYVGLFARADFSYFQDLTLINPQVQGDIEVGSLVGSTRYGTKIQRVTVRGAQIAGIGFVGLLVGTTERGGAIIDTSVQGVVRGTSGVRNIGTIASPSLGGGIPHTLGGMIGEENSTDRSGTNLRNTVDVTITHRPHRDYNTVSGLGSLTMYNVGGYSGQLSKYSTYRHLSVKAQIDLEVFGSVDRVGGVAGRNSVGPSEIDSDASIRIVSLRNSGESEIRNVGGAIGESDELSMSFSNVSSTIQIERANVSNNSLGITNSAGTMTVSRVAGMTGFLDDAPADLYSRVKTQIDIEGATSATLIAGFVGGFDEAHGLGNSDVFVSGGLNVNASSSINKVAGFANLESSGTVAGERLFSAVAISLSGAAASGATRVGPFIGSIEEDNFLDPLPSMRVFNSFWDSDVNTRANPAGYPAKPATTSQLKSKSFLEAQGMDFRRAWKISSGEYPELCESLYTFGERGLGCSSSSGAGANQAQAGGATPAITSLTNRVSPGQLVTIQGANLRNVTGILVDNRLVNYTVRTDGSIRFRAPKSASGRIVVKLQSASSGISDSRTIRIKDNRKKISQTIEGFDGDSPELTNQVRSAISSFLRRLPDRVSLVCVGSTSNTVVTAFDRALATQRAKRACDFAKEQNPRLQTSIRIEPASGLGPSARNVRLILKNY
jgi:hypothetical protein